MRSTVVLIVEDEVIVLDLLADMVTELGHITTAKAKPDMLPARAYFVAKPYSQAQIGEAMERAN
jgi:hypothetical protein